MLEANDQLFASTDLTLSPDGAVYVADWFDRRTAHPDPDADWDRSNGRIYKIEAKDAKPPPRFDLGKKSSKELVAYLRHPNGWFTDQARVLLAGRRDRAVWPKLRDFALQEND